MYIAYGLNRLGQAKVVKVDNDRHQLAWGRGGPCFAEIGNRLFGLSNPKLKTSLEVRCKNACYVHTFPLAQYVITNLDTRNQIIAKSAVGPSPRGQHIVVLVTVATS